MTKVFTAFKLPSVEPTCPGNPIRKEYEKAYHADGSAYLVEVGETNTDDLIQSALETVALPSLYQRFLNGDQTALESRSGGVFMDVSKVKDLNDLLAFEAAVTARLEELQPTKTVDQNVPSVEKAEPVTE